MTTRSVLFVFSMVGLLSLLSCGERPQRDDRAPGDAFPGGPGVPVEDTSIFGDTVATDSIPSSVRHPMHP